MNKRLIFAENLVHLLENQFQIFGFKFGIDPLLGLVPGLGDLVAYGLSFYLVWLAYDLGLPKLKIGQMILNITIDFAVGLYPVLGDIADFAIKPNSRNLQIIKEFLSSQGSPAKR